MAEAGAETAQKNTVARGDDLTAARRMRPCRSPSRGPDHETGQNAQNATAIRPARTVCRARPQRRAGTVTPSGHTAADGQRSGDIRA